MLSLNRFRSRLPIKNGALCFSSEKSRNFYAELGLSPEATAEDIKAAFYALSKEHHPDVSGGDGEKFQRISEAHSVLSNVALRREYDKGTLGRLTSVADREAAAHKYDGENFYAARNEYKRQYRPNRGHVDDTWVKATRAKAFHGVHGHRAKSSVMGGGSGGGAGRGRGMPNAPVGGGGASLFSLIATVTGVTALVVLAYKTV